MKRTSMNPWTWSQDFGFSQGELLEHPRRQLWCSGQAATDADGAPQHGGVLASRWGAAEGALRS